MGVMMTMAANLVIRAKYMSRQGGYTAGTTIRTDQWSSPPYLQAAQEVARQYCGCLA